MASLHHRPSRGDLFRPSTAPDPAATAFPRRATAYESPALRNPFPREIYTTAPSPPPPPTPRQQFSMALPAASGRQRCGDRVRGVRVWCFSDPEMKRQRRVARYKAYGVEGKVKASLRRGLRWFKRKCSVILHF
ncbi:uncharacterized protein LOC133909882 [Phragmites australis]|uniref:uncharacterized protein LOC133909882 n=1 Tax=Phragmites australis TaxID=29695 RepID=UPI002D79200C|nr:uncharacterized protein LOC133909882 [Phragmites australis]